MKRFGDYGIAPIKCETRMGGADVKDWLYRINNILYPHKYDYGVFEIGGSWYDSNLYLYKMVK